MTEPTTIGERQAIAEIVREAADAYRKFVAAREAMNAAIPSMSATPAEYALYDERCKADHETQREHWRTAIILAQNADSILRALLLKDNSDAG